MKTLTTSDGYTELITLESTNMVKSTKVWLNPLEKVRRRTERKARRSSRRRPSRLDRSIEILAEEVEGEVHFGLVALSTEIY